MNRTSAYALFDDMISVAQREIVSFTTNHDIVSKIKGDDKQLVTSLDEHIDAILSAIARRRGLLAVSEEGEHDLEIVRQGNYMVIDPIDGTLAFREHWNTSKSYKNPHFGSAYHYALLIGVVEEGRPRFGCCYNYITQEKIFVDSDGDITRGGTVGKPFSSFFARYADVRAEDFINKKLDEDVTLATHRFRSLGIASMEAQLNPHQAFVLAHFPQQNGLWDILPAGARAACSGTKILDGNGDPLSYTEYIHIPKGVVLYKGEEFAWVEEELKKGII